MKVILKQKLNLRTLFRVFGRVMIVGSLFFSLSASVVPVHVYAGQQEPLCKENISGASEADADSAEKKCTVEVNDCNQSFEETDGSNCKIVYYLNLFVRILSAMVGVVVVVVIIIGGIQYSMSGGDAQAVAAAKQRISNALLALVIYAFSFAFLQWIIPGGIL